MKKIINCPETLVREMCAGIALADPSVQFIPKYKIIKKRAINQNKVTLISGGGSGHEPAHAGFVGKGMLDAAVCGDVFASPSQIQVYKAIKETESTKGTLLIIKNYSGDMMNFKNAASMAADEGIDVDYVCVNDDIAVQDSLYTVGRRGVAGTVLIHKLAGAAAEQGMSLAEVKKVAEDAIKNVKSIGFALTSCTVPAKGSPTFYLQDYEMEYGVGIHGEPGVQKEHILPADKLAKRMTGELLKELDMIDNQSDEVAVMINGFGGTPLQELYLLEYAVAKELKEKGIKVFRFFVGNYMTSIDMAGASVSIMRLNKERKQLLSAPCETAALHIDGDMIPDMTVLDQQIFETIQDGSFKNETSPEWANVKGDQLTLENLIYMVDLMSEVIIDNEVPFCELDSHAGDGDFGMSISKGFRQLKREWAEIMSSGANSISDFLSSVSMVIMEHCGGASGPIWGAAFRAASFSIKGKDVLNLADFADMMQAAVTGIYKTGERSFGKGAVVGDKTLVDALAPCADILTQSAKNAIPMVDAMINAAKAAVAGAEQTKNIVARMGRAGTVGERSLGYPDAGAHALGFIFTKLAENMKPLN